MARLRIFAGPNGSGKSTLFSQIKGSFNVGNLVNADNFLSEYKSNGLFDFSKFDLSTDTEEWTSFYKQHGLRRLANSLESSKVVTNFLIFKRNPDSYEMAILSDFIRCKLIETKHTFSCETVFSHQSKLDLMQHATDCGYRCYLYFTSVEDSTTSIKRVQQRVAVGGHAVPIKKITERYDRTMNNLLPAIRLAYRSFIFDNSGSEMNLVMEVTPSREVVFKSNRIPVWVDTYVLSRLN